MINPMRMCDAFLSWCVHRADAVSGPHPTTSGANAVAVAANSKSVAPPAGSRIAAVVPAVVFVLMLGGVFAVPPLRGQATQPQQAPPPDQQKPAPPATEANPFPTDTSNVPVMPNANTPAPAPTETTSAPPLLPSDESDPVRSPDDPAPALPSSGDSSDSSSGIDLARIMPSDDTHGKGSAAAPPQHKETAQEDEKVGSFYLSDHDWKGALSRFESALVLDPENPDVYWGLAEAQRHLGKFAEAKANYEKVMEYDPGSRHAKDAKKILRDPELANAAAPPSTP